MKIGDLVVTTAANWRAPAHMYTGRIGVITYCWNGTRRDFRGEVEKSGAYVLFTEDGREIWFEDDEFEVVSERG